MEVAIGPVTGRALYSYMSGSHVLFYVYSCACHFLLFLSFSHRFCGAVRSVCDRILVFYVQFLWKDFIVIT